MTTVRKGLSLRNHFVEPGSKEHVKAVLRKSPMVTKQPEQTKADKKLPFQIYEDSAQFECQHCGSTRNNPQVISVSCGVQTSNVDIREWLCGENPPENYWEELAERRRVALKETLDENKELCDLIESLNKELERLSHVEKQADHFAKMYQVLKNEKDHS
ncbi:Geminin [Paragonimus heterotremus]|uniref:Geminin n=1 Tax=Paragonimus heterotremus TaxID=100268 RepID=A0A8J4SYV2_9TREM|nr:Geminin [Paragonimus heterotremus]